MHIWVTMAIIVVLDRITKIIVQSNLQLGDSIVVIPGFFHITYILNPGAAFGMLAGKTWFFNLTSIIVIGAILYFVSKVPRNYVAMRVCMGLIAGGALGNLYDRIFVGKVIDFLDFKVWSYIFNIADSALVVGSILLGFLIYKQPLDSEEKGIPNG